jgi:YHS domain-containing protein
MRVSLIPALLLSLGCTRPEFHAGPGQAVDPVCAYNRDLACVVIAITPETPKAEFKRETYYFCSASCRAAFLRNPHRYLRGS